MKPNKSKAKNRPKARKPRSLSVAGGSAPICFANKDGHIMKLSRSMTLRELMKMGVVEIHITKPGTPLR